MNVEQMKYRKVSDLHPLASNPRKITKAEFDRLVDSIRTVSYTHLTNSTANAIT